MIREINSKANPSESSFWEEEEIICELEKSKKTF